MGEFSYLSAEVGGDKSIILSSKFYSINTSQMTGNILSSLKILTNT